MPSYTFRNRKTGSEINMFMSISEMETFMKDHPDMERVYNTLNIIDPVTAGRIKTDNEFNSLLKEIKKRTGGTAVNTR